MHEEKERKKKNKTEIFAFNFLTVRRTNGTIGVYFTLEYVRADVYKTFASLCCGYLGAALIPYVHIAIFDLPNPYLRNITLLLD